MPKQGYSYEDDVAPDFSAVRANARLELHEAVCAERYGSLWAAIGDLKTLVANVQTSVTESNTQHHSRFNVMSGRMWGLLVWVAGATIMALGTIVFYLITRGH